MNRTSMILLYSAAAMFAGAVLERDLINQFIMRGEATSFFVGPGLPVGGKTPQNPGDPSNPTHAICYLPLADRSIRLHVKDNFLSQLGAKQPICPPKKSPFCLGTLPVDRASGDDSDVDGNETEIPVVDPPVDEGKQWGTPIDFVVTKDYWHGSGSDNTNPLKDNLPILFKIILDDPAMMFMHYYDASGKYDKDTAYALKQISGVPEMFDCLEPLHQEKIYKDRSDTEGTYKWVLKLRIINRGPETSGLNIGILAPTDATNDFFMPLDIDPKPRNGGAE